MRGKRICSFDELCRRFWTFVSWDWRIVNNCWVWTGSRNSLGYGDFKQALKWGYSRKPHRFSFQIKNGKDSLDGLEINHICGNPSCVRPYHLEAVPAGWNAAQGRANRIYKKKSHCINGHERTEDNICKGNRSCRICANMRKRLKRKELRDAEIANANT